MMQRKNAIAILLIFALLSCSKKNPIVARIDEIPISREEFVLDFLRDRTIEEALQADSTTIRKHLDSLVAQRILFKAAYDAKLDQHEYVQYRMKPMTEFYLNRRLYELEVLNRYIPEREIKDHYNKSKYDVVVEQLSIIWPSHTAENIKTDWEQKIEKVLVRKGKQGFDIVIAELKQAGVPFGMETHMDTLQWRIQSNQMLESAYNLKRGAVTQVLKTGDTWHSLRMLMTIEREQPLYNEIRDELLRQLEKRYQRFLYQKAREFANGMLNEDELKWQDEAILKLSNHLRKLPSPRCDVLLKAFSKMNTETLSDVLVLVNEKKVDVEYIYQKIQSFEPMASIQLNNPERIKNALTTWLADERVSEMARRRGLEKDKWVVAQLKDSLEIAMLSVLLDRDIVGPIDTSETQLQSFYRENLDSLFSIPEQVKIQEILVSDSVLAVDIAQRARRGESFNRLVQLYTEREAFKQIKAVIGPFIKGKWGKIGDTAFQMKLNEIAGPVKHEEGYSIILLLERIPKKAIEYQDTQNYIKKDYVDEIKKTRLNFWIDNWKKEHSVVIYEDKIGKRIYD